MRRKDRRKLFSCARILLAAIGFPLCIAAILYPSVSNYLYEKGQSRIITEYREAVSDIDSDFVEQELEKCRLFNEGIRRQQLSASFWGASGVVSNSLDMAEYEALLNVNGDSIMGYLEIPKIHLYLPVYHDTTQRVLENGLGHVPQSSLPVGGAGTHAVITGHSGMADKKMFTELSELEPGDNFCFHVLGKDLYYQVEEKSIVLPHETQSLLIDEEKDQMTLVTCTPLGINSHRLLVHATRMQNVYANQTEKPEKEVEKNR